MGNRITIAGTECSQVSSEQPDVDLFVGQPEGEDTIQVARHHVRENRWTVALFVMPQSGPNRFSLVASGSGPTREAAEDAMQAQMARAIRMAVAA